MDEHFEKLTNDPTKKWLLRKKDFPKVLPLENNEQAYQGPTNDGLSNQRNEINTGVNSNTVTPNPQAYV